MLLRFRERATRARASSSGQQCRSALLASRHLRVLNCTDSPSVATEAAGSGEGAIWEKSTYLTVYFDFLFFRMLCLRVDEVRELELVVQIRTDRQTGNPLREAWQLNTDGREFHRPDGGPTFRKWNKDTGVLTTEEYHRYGVLHREDGPAATRRDPITGRTLSERWTLSHQLHREDGKPAIWWSDPETGIVIGEEYWERGERHRLDGPSVVARDRVTGEVTHTEYHHRGQQLPGPPQIPGTLDLDS